MRFTGMPSFSMGRRASSFRLLFRLSRRRACRAAARERGEVVQCYFHDCEATARVPVQKLVGFTRVSLLPGATAEVKFTITPEMLALIDESGKARIEPGVFEVTVGGSSTPDRAGVLGAP